MTGYKDHPALEPRLIGYDPVVDLASDHLARLVDAVVDKFVCVQPKAVSAGQPERSPRVLLKVVLYSCLTGVHSSRRMASNCHESLPYLLLVRDDRPCHTVLADTRRLEGDLLRVLFGRLQEFAMKVGMPFLGRIAIDSSKFSAHASSDSLVRARDMDKTLAAFEAILACVEEADAREDIEGAPVHTSTGVSTVQMREVLRAISKDSADALKLSPRMVARVKKGVETLKSAQAEGLSHVSLTDPDARMMPIGAGKKVGMGYQFEAVTDGGNLVVAQTGNHASDGGRLLPLVDLARQADPVAVTQATADTGYFNGGQVKELLASGLDVVVPDKATARELRHGPMAPSEPPIEFTKVEGIDAYRCPEGNILKATQRFERDGQRFTKYVAIRECAGCPLASRCLKQKGAKRRNLKIGEFRDELKAYAARFLEPEMRKAYDARGPAIETVFALVRSVFSFDRWHVIGKESVASEGALLSCSIQLKKIQVHLRREGKTFTEAMA